MTPHKIIEAAINAAHKRGARRAEYRLEDITSASEYAEPGYSTSHDTILFGNWNGFRDWNEAEHRFVPHEPDDSIMRRTVKLLEQVAELEWSDEWSLCSQCGEALRTLYDTVDILVSSGRAGVDGGGVLADAAGGCGHDGRVSQTGHGGSGECVDEGP